MCDTPLSASHVLHDCPLRVLTAWHVCVKLCLLIPSLNPCWHRCFPTPCGVLVQTTKGLLLLSDQGTGSFRFPHEQFHFSVFGEISSLSVHIAMEHGATELMGFWDRSLYKLHHQSNMPLLPIYPNFIMPRNLYGLVAHVLTLPDTVQCSWTPWTDDAII